MSSEERIYKQVEELSASILKALEGLENELSEYMDDTDKRLHFLEEKVKKLEAFIEASKKTSIIETTTTTSPKVIAPPTTDAPFQKPFAPTTKTIPPIPRTPQVEASVKKEDVQQKEEIGIAPQIDRATIPPIPKPPSFSSVKESVEGKEGLMELPERKTADKPKDDVPISDKLDEKEKKENDKDKEELLTALKKIDAL